MLFPGHAVNARGVHDALLAHAAVAGVIVTGIEEMVEPLVVPHDGAGAQRRVGIGHQAVVQRHAVVLVAHKIIRGEPVDRMIALAVVIGVIQVIELQRVILGHIGHGVAHIAALRRGIEAIVHRCIGFRQSALGNERKKGRHQNRHGHCSSVHTVYSLLENGKDWKPGIPASSPQSGKSTIRPGTWPRSRHTRRWP